MRVLLGVISLIFATGASASAQDWRDVERMAHRTFDNLPDVELVDVMPDTCGADPDTNPDMRYCTSENRITLRDQSENPEGTRRMAHALAHGFGHAIQVRHGIADIALREVRSRPSEEAELRRMVTGQVECLAGFLIARSGFAPVDLREIYDVEPFQDSHWGSNPLRVGPKVSAGLEFRADWIRTGFEQGISACTVGEIDVGVLLASDGYRGD